METSHFPSDFERGDPATQEIDICSFEIIAFELVTNSNFYKTVNRFYGLYTVEKIEASLVIA